MINTGKVWISTLSILTMLLILTNSCTKNYNNVIVPATITDIDGNVYHTVTIGTQVWLVENLKTTRYRHGNPIPNVTDSTAWDNLYLANTGAYCYYNNDPANAATYGLLYNWYAVNDTDSIAPKGWHVPGQTEWTTMSTYLGSLESVGGMLKETGTIHWQTPNTGAKNEFLFSALPGGQRLSHGSFTGIGTTGAWWSSTLDGTYDAWGRYINYNDSTLFRYDDTKKVGFSIRCVMDYPTTN
jgi:uncharacterized protein (TIGR02145 family)